MPFGWLAMFMAITLIKSIFLILRSARGGTLPSFFAVYCFLHLAKLCEKPESLNRMREAVSLTGRAVRSSTFVLGAIGLCVLLLGGRYFQVLHIQANFDFDNWVLHLIAFAGFVYSTYYWLSSLRNVDPSPLCLRGIGKSCSFFDDNGILDLNFHELQFLVFLSINLFLFFSTEASQNLFPLLLPITGLGIYSYFLTSKNGHCIKCIRGQALLFSLTVA